MLFSLMLMSPAGMVGGLTHMLFHSVLKITLFFVAGAIIYKTGREYVDQIEGFGYSMPITMVCFTITSLGLMGIPPLMGLAANGTLLRPRWKAGTLWRMWESGR